MEHPDAAEPRTPDASPADEALRRLEQRLGRASEAAERLIAEAARTAGAARAPGAASTPEPAAETETPAPDASAGSAEHPPPSGWQVPAGEQARTGDMELLLQVLQSLRELIPPELQRRLAEALRELLLALRALIDWYLERNERRRSTSGEVQDIPIL